MVMPWENAFQGIDNWWNGRITNQGGQQAGSPASKFDGLLKSKPNSTFDFGRDVMKPASKAIYDPSRSKTSNDALNAHFNRTSPQGNKATADKTRAARPVGNADGSTTFPEKPMEGTLSNAVVEKSQLEKFQEYLSTIDPGDYDYKKSITDAFAKAYAGLDKAANTAKDNKANSSRAIAGLAEGGSNLVKKESATYQKITDDTARTNNSVYGGQVAGLQADRSKEVADRATFLQKLGIQEAGMGSAGSTQTSAINEALGTQARSGDRINAYGQADQSLNNSRAQSILNEGTTRQADLESQLTKILGGIEGKRSEIGVQEAQAMQQAEQQAYAQQLAKFQAGVGAYDKAIDQDFKTRDQQLQEMEFQMKYGDGKGGLVSAQQQALTPTGSQAADAYITSQGEDPNTYRSFMTQFMTELANDPNVRTNQVNDSLIRGKMLEEAAKSGLDPNKVNIMWEYQQNAPVKYMKQNQLAQ